MKFDYVVGNPPYQETKGGTKNVDIWPDFLFGVNKIANFTTLIHPGRWIVPKKQMKNIHDKIINDGLKCFDYFVDSSKIFSQTGIDGGISITCFKKGYKGKIKYYNAGKFFGEYNSEKNFISNKYEEEIIEKINDIMPYTKTMKERILGNIGSLGGSEFGYNKTQHIGYLKDTKDGLEQPVLIWANNGYGKGTRFKWNYIEKNVLKNVPAKLFSSRKVMLDKKGHAISNSTANIINNIPQIVEKKATASGDVLFAFPENDTKYELELIQSMFMTKTVRFLMSITQKDLYVRGFENIPDYLYFVKALKGKLFSDEFFYKKFNFSKELIAYIESHVSGKSLDDNEKNN